jgi:serine protease Do
MVLSDFEGKITGSVDQLSEAVVVIRSIKLVHEIPFRTIPIKGSGSGFIIDSNGHIVTNYHVIDGASKVEVTLKDGRTYIGNVIGGDRATDVVLIKVEATHLPVVTLGDSEKLKVGQIALAIGNALDLPGAPTVSAGVISAIGRPMPWADFIFEGLLQTDAAINPGNSGGPLADLDGKVIGINTAIVPFAQGVGFAIPINTVKWVVEQVLIKGKVTRPVLGVSVSNLNPLMVKRFNLATEHGVMVTGVYPNKPAQIANMRDGDIIYKIDSYEVNNIKDLLVAISKLPTKENIIVKFLREGKKQEAKLKLVEASLEN